MAKPNKHQYLSLWRLVNLGQELEEIAVRLALLAAKLQHGLDDHKEYQAEQRRTKRRIH